MKTLETQEQYIALCNAVQSASSQPIEIATAMTRHVLVAIEHPLVSLTAADKTAIEGAAQQDGGIEAWLDSNPARHVAVAAELPEVWTIYQDQLSLRATMKRLREQQFPKKV